MPNDFLKKQPSKNEQMFYQLMMNQETLDRRIWTTSSFVTAMAILMDIKPEKIAEMLTVKQSQVQDFSKKINEEIDKIEAAQKETEPSEGHLHAGHDHHNHSHVQEQSEEISDANASAIDADIATTADEA